MIDDELPKLKWTEPEWTELDHRLHDERKGRSWFKTSIQKLDPHIQQQAQIDRCWQMELDRRAMENAEPGCRGDDIMGLYGPPKLASERKMR